MHIHSDRKPLWILIYKCIWHTQIIKYFLRDVQFSPSPISSSEHSHHFSLQWENVAQFLLFKQGYLPSFLSFKIKQIKLNRFGCCQITSIIKTITKFSNAIGYEQPDLSHNWTVPHVMLEIGQGASFCARCCCALCWVNCWVFRH